MHSTLRAACATLVLCLASAVPAYAQAPAKFGEVPPPGERGYTVGWLLAAGLAGMAVAAGCRSAFRTSKAGEA